MSEPPRPILTAAEYLERERNAEYKSEYYQGEMFAMAGGSVNHSLIAANLIATLRSLLKGSGCRVFTGDLRLLIPASGFYTYPDVTVVCGELQVLDEMRDTVMNPVVLIEVLSPSTESYDRGQKFFFYRSIPSLREYVLVSQQTRHIEVFRRRNGDGVWELHESNDSGEITLESIGCEFPVEDVYAEVEMQERTGLR
jgi:Uma2 family endonuclease